MCIPFLPEQKSTRTLWNKFNGVIFHQRLTLSVHIEQNCPTSLFRSNDNCLKNIH